MFSISILVLFSVVGRAQALCPPGQIQDCNGVCAPATWLGDNSCDNGSFYYNGTAIYLDCPLFNYDDGDCVVSSNCALHEIDDCYGHCAPASWLGDGSCDNGAYTYNRTAIYLDCAYYTYDNNDCAAPDGDGDGYDVLTDCDDSDASINPGATEISNDGIDQDCDGYDLLVTLVCASTEIEDCNGHCAPSSWLGDTSCDNGSYNYLGNAIYLDCPLFDYDDGDCVVSNRCASNEIEDCYGNCAPSVWLGDTACDNGTFTYNGNAIYLDCSYYNYDNGDCASILDLDGDGYTPIDGDCDDDSSSIYPGANEIAEDGIDQDCDGSDYTCPAGEIADCYGHCVPTTWLGNAFCDDGSYSYNGNAIYLDCFELNLDNGDCVFLEDGDGDGYYNNVDCNDGNSYIYPGASEILNDGIDQDCDGGDDSTCTVGHISDCNSICAPVYWLGDGTCDNGTNTYDGYSIDFDCATNSYDNGDCNVSPVWPDYDSDGYNSSVDCNDNDDTINPGAPEIANDGIDQDCDGSDLIVGCPINEMEDCNGVCVSSTLQGDNNCDTILYCAELLYDAGDCEQDGDGYTPMDGDCDDSDATLNPSDTDGDGISSCDGDCDDLDNSVYPGATEIADDGIDQDCNGNDLMSPDNDRDGYPSTIDCNDNDASIYPGATDIPNNGKDEDCDGEDATTSEPSSEPSSEPTSEPGGEDTDDSGLKDNTVDKDNNSTKACTQSNATDFGWMAMILCFIGLRRRT